MNNPDQTKPLRVMYVENGIGYGGAIICLRHLAANIDRERIEPFVVTGRTGPDYQGIAEEAHWAWIRDRYVDTVGLRESLEGTEWINNIPPLRWLLSQLIARIDDVANFIPLLVRLSLFVRRHNIELIHANNEPVCNRAALIAAKIMKIPAVCHVRGQQTGSRSIRWFYQLPDHFLSVSSWVAAGIATHDVAESKISVIYDGIPLNKLDIDADGSGFRARYGVADDEFAIGIVGLLIPWKGQNLFLDAVSQLRNELAGVKFLIVGGTPDDCVGYEKELRERVIQEQLSEIVVFCGHQTEMMSVYNGLDVAVSASTTPEPLGTMVIETMAMARPLLAPKHGGAAEMAEDDVTAILFEPGDANSLADGMRKYFRDQAFRDRVRHAARAHALKTFAVEAHVKNVMDIYQLVVDPKRIESAYGLAEPGLPVDATVND